MFFLHALLLFFLLGTTSSSMAAVLPRNAAPDGDGYGNLQIRGLPSASTKLQGFWELDSDGNDLTLIHFNSEGKLDWVYKRVMPNEGQRHGPRLFDLGVYKRVVHKVIIDDLPAKVTRPPGGFTQPSDQHSNWLEFEESAGGIIIKCGESKHKHVSFAYEAVAKPYVKTTIAQTELAVLPPSIHK